MKTTFLRAVVLLTLMGTAAVAVSQAPAVAHNTWTSGAAMPTAVMWPFVGVIKGQIYVVGGCTVLAGPGACSDTGGIADAQIYDPATNTWSAGAALPRPLYDGGAAVVNNVLYVIGGVRDGQTSLLAYSPRTNKWSSRTPMPAAEYDTTAVVVENNIIYVIGGNGNGVVGINTVESYNPATDTWTEEAPLLVPKTESSVGLVGTTIVAADGNQGNDGGDTGDNEGYDASTNTWTSLASDPTPRNGACGGAIGARLYVAGGYNGSGPDMTLTESFNLPKNAWKPLAPMPQATLWGGSAVYKGQLYCFGGAPSYGGGSALDYVQIYQP